MKSLVFLFIFLCLGVWLNAQSNGNKPLVGADQNNNKTPDEKMAFYKECLSDCANTFRAENEADLRAACIEACKIHLDKKSSKDLFKKPNPDDKDNKMKKN